MTDDDKAELAAGYAVIKQAREWLAKQTSDRTAGQIRTPSPATIAAYTKDFERLKATGDVWQAAADTTKKSTYFKYRAAILHHCRQEVSEQLRIQDRLQRENGPADLLNKTAWTTKIKRIKAAIDLAGMAPAEPPIEEVERRETKRRDLWKLPADWRELLIERLPKYRAQAAVTALTGCRPAELVHGVEVSVTGDSLSVLIRGAKISTESGQEWRRLTWDLPSGNPLVMLLAGILRDCSESQCVERVISTPDARTFSGAMREAGKRAFPKFKHTITPYSLRHQFSSDLKTAELPGDQISQALGHSANKTKGSYGAFGHGRGGMAPQAVSAARAVRQAPAPQAHDLMRGPSPVSQ